MSDFIAGIIIIVIASAEARKCICSVKLMLGVVYSHKRGIVIPLYLISYQNGFPVTKHVKTEYSLVSSPCVGKSFKTGSGRKHYLSE